MKFGIRECANITLRALNTMRIGNTIYAPQQPVLYVDTAKTSTLEGAATTVYATGGRGNARLIAWEGERTLTFTFEDALLSPISFSMLSGAGLIKGKESENVHVHTVIEATIGASGKIDCQNALAKDEDICDTAPTFVIAREDDGSLTGEMLEITNINTKDVVVNSTKQGKSVMIDCYIVKKSSHVSELQIDMEHFGGYFYVEAETLWRDQATGTDHPAIFTLPKAKIQSNFTFSLSSEGDPSTFTFTMDAFPGYTYFNKSRKILCGIQIIEDTSASEKEIESVFKHGTEEEENELYKTYNDDKVKYTNRATHYTYYKDLNTPKNTNTTTESNA